MNGPSLVFSALLLFCRIGVCLMIAPGVGNTQIPSQIRLYGAIGITLALTPLLFTETHVEDLGPVGMSRDIVGELLVGGVMGTLARLFFSALETLSFAASTMLSLANPFGVEVDRDQPLPPLAALVTLAAVTMMFVADFHWQIVIALVDSYRAVPFGSVFDARHSLTEIGDVLGQSFTVAIRIASPFFLYSVIMNFAMALINRVTPQIAIFFIAPPFVVGGGLVLLYFTIRGQVSEFMAAFSHWLAAF